MVDNSDIPSSADITRKLLMTPTQVNLVEMAALADISATSYSLNTIIEEECQPTDSSGIKAIQIPSRVCSALTDLQLATPTPASATSFSGSMCSG